MAIRPLLPVLVACVLVGCGEDAPSAEEQIRSTLGEFQRATAAGDYGALCDRILAPQLIESVERIGLPCEEALAKGFEDVRDPQLSVGAITVNGDTATAQVRSSAAGQEPSDDSVALIRTDAGWRIASLAGGAP